MYCTIVCAIELVFTELFQVSQALFLVLRSPISMMRRRLVVGGIHWDIPNDFLEDFYMCYFGGRDVDAGKDDSP